MIDAFNRKDSDVFLFSSAGTLVFVTFLLLVSLFVPARRITVCTCSWAAVVIGVAATLSIQFGVQGAHWPGSIICGCVIIFFGFWILFDVQAVQIDLTADEYIIAAVDLYLDVVNLFLWLLVCLIYCFGMAAGR